MQDKTTRQPHCPLCDGGKVQLSGRGYYDGLAQRRAYEQEQAAATLMMLKLGIPPNEVAQWVSDAQHRRRGL
jgi:hypothetical protein